MSDLVVKDNSLINASYNLSLVEQRLILLAIVATRKDDHVQAWDFWLGKPIKVTAQSYIEAFDVSRQTAYEVLKDACKTLFSRQFTYEEYRKKGSVIKTTRWVSDIAYNNETSTVEFTFTPSVLPLITRLEEHLTSYELQQIADLNSGYAVRLYELLISWKIKGQTPQIKLEKLRKNLGVDNHEYTRMYDFKKYVLDNAIKQINKHTDLKATYEQHKKGRTIQAFSFSFKQKKKTASAGNKEIARDPTTADMFLEGLTDKQLARAVHSKKFIADYNGLVSAQNPANQSSGAWVAHMVEWLKKDPSNFAKRPMQEYLDDEQAQRF